MPDRSYGLGIAQRVTPRFTVCFTRSTKRLNYNGGTTHAWRAFVEDYARYAHQRLVAFHSRDDPFDLFRGLLFALPTSVLGFWLPVALFMARLRTA